ncbi:MAG: DUF126 domain-containing protein [Rhizobiaceae bacterium]|nr:DUF126 domain-containing protein [Rhizobiaceae bacterium]
MTWQSEVLIEGEAHGEVLRFDAPISFWGGISPVTSQVILAGHPQQGTAIADKILVIPQMIGSSSSSAVMLELFYTNMAPRALILGSRDAILPVGVVVARQMGWPIIPVVVLPEAPFLSADKIYITRNGQIEKD